MTPDQVPSNLKCEVNIIKARNLALDPSANLFVRCYLSIGNGRRILINTREISSKADPNWNEFTSLEHLGTMDSVRGLLDRDGVTFELRQRKSTPILGKFTRSKLMGRAEVPWKDVLESTDMSTEKWINVSTGGRTPVNPKLPALLVRLKIQFSQVMEMGIRRGSQPRKWKECNCQHCDCNSFGDEDMFAVAAAIEAW